MDPGFTEGGFTFVRYPPRGYPIEHPVSEAGAPQYVSEDSEIGGLNRFQGWRASRVRNADATPCRKCQLVSAREDIGLLFIIKHCFWM